MEQLNLIGGSAVAVPYAYSDRRRIGYLLCLSTTWLRLPRKVIIIAGSLIPISFSATIFSGPAIPAICVFNSQARRQPCVKSIDALPRRRSKPASE